MSLNQAGSPIMSNGFNF